MNRYFFLTECYNHCLVASLSIFFEPVVVWLRLYSISVENNALILEHVASLLESTSFLTQYLVRLSRFKVREMSHLQILKVRSVYVDLLKECFLTCYKILYFRKVNCSPNKYRETNNF